MKKETADVIKSHEWTDDDDAERFNIFKHQLFFSEY